jgi:hypothetical protein
VREAGFGRRGPYPCIGRSGRGFRGGGLLFLLFMLFGAAVPLHARGEDPRPDPRCGTGAGKTGTLARWPPQTLRRGRSRSHSLHLVLGRWGEFAPLNLGQVRRAHPDHLRHVAKGEPLGQSFLANQRAEAHGGRDYAASRARPREGCEPGAPRALTPLTGRPIDRSQGGGSGALSRVECSTVRRVLFPRQAQ